MSIVSPYAARTAAMPATERVLDVLGSETHLWEYGDPDSDTVLLVVHGYRGEHHGLEPVVVQLDGLRILSPDLPGFGISTPMTEAEHDIAGYAAWLHDITARLRDEVGRDRRFVVVGHSFGSIVVSAALADGLDVDAAVLINPIAAPALKGPRGVMTRGAIVYYQIAAALPERAGFGLLANPLIVRVMSETMAKTKDKRLRRWIHDQHDTYFSAFATRTVVLDAFRASVSHDVGEYADRIAVPTLMIAADRDDITPIQAQHDVVARIPDAELVVIHGVGHLIHYERPVEAARAIRAFLARLDDAATVVDPARVDDERTRS